MRQGLPVVLLAAIVASLVTGRAAGAQPAPDTAQARARAARSLVYSGDRDFPPYEYLDAQGRPQGFNVELVRALARELRVPVEIHLSAWKDVVARLDAGEADLVSLAYTDRRAARYVLLWQTWTLHQSLVFRPGRASYPLGLGGLAREVVAVEDRSLMAELIRALPERERPAIVGVPSQVEAITRLGRHGVTAVAGNDLTLRHAAAALDLNNLVVVPVKSVSYHLATRPGSSVDALAVTAALRHLTETGEIDRLVELHLSHPVRRTSWRDQIVPIGLAAALVLAVLGAFLLYNRQLRTQVANRTEELERSLLEVRRSGRARERALEALQASESRYRSLIQNMLGGLLVVNDKGRIVLANPSADRMFGYEPGQLVGESVVLLVPLRDTDAAESFLRGAAGQALGRITEWQGRRKNGSVFPFELSMFEFESPGGRLFAGHLVDISERREVARMKDEFVSSCARRSPRCGRRCNCSSPTATRWSLPRRATSSPSPSTAPSGSSASSTTCSTWRRSRRAGSSCEGARAPRSNSFSRRCSPCGRWPTAPRWRSALPWLRRSPACRRIPIASCRRSSTCSRTR